MSQLGERLRAAREAQGISVAQASAETRILPRYIVALEDGDYQHLPGDVYARGFIRNYAGYLGMGAEELIELYRVDRGSTDPIKVVATTSTPKIRGLFVPSFFGVFFVVIAFVCILYLVMNLTSTGGGSQLATGDVPTVAPTPEPLPTWGSVPTTAASDQPAVASQPTTPAATPPDQQVAGGAISTPTPTAQAQSAPIVGSVRIAPGDHKGSWIRITTDRKVIYEGALSASTIRDFSAQNSVRVRAGNAGVVYVTINGVEQGPLGSEGQVFDFAWPPQ
ncbi:helix-turn-helix domain-containing protein [Chloroflexia bacterium SDU3-3]|nr:helix-turn-helix domain-containing protein [Chloroflexia bacterium SDU3-3]